MDPKAQRIIWLGILIVAAAGGSMAVRQYVIAAASRSAPPVPRSETPPLPSAAVGASEASAGNADPAEGDVPPDRSGPAVRQIAPNRYEIFWDRLETHAGVDTAPDARIVPAFRQGAPIGFKLFAIRPGSAYQQAGVQNGDVLVKVNGEAMTVPDRMLELYQKLSHARGTEVTVELERRGAPVRLTYVIR